MAITIYRSGTAIIGTAEYSLVNNSTTLATDTTPGVFQVFIDLTAMQGGDEYIINIKDRTVSGGAQLVIYESTLEGTQTSPFVAPTLILFYGWDVTVQRITGVNRSISWSIRQVA